MSCRPQSVNTAADHSGPDRSVSLIVIATGLYASFIPTIVAGASSHLRGLHRVYALTDTRPDPNDLLTWLPWGHMCWPYPTLMRYRAISAHQDILRESDVLLYIDVDMRIDGEVDVRSASGTIAVVHPGYSEANRDAFPYESRAESTSYVSPDEGLAYFAGGVQGGDAASYLSACAVIAESVQQDLASGVIPVWHDESAWNRYCIDRPPSIVLPPQYCSPEYFHDPDAVIVALDKNHDHLRQTPLRIRAERRLRRLRVRTRAAAARPLRGTTAR